MHYQVIAAFRAAMQSEGIEPPDNIEADGILHRFHIPGQKSGSLNGAYTLHLDGSRPAGFFQDFKNDVKITWKADGPTKPLNRAERQQIEEAKANRAKQLAQRQDRAAKRAVAIWKDAKPCR